MNKNLEEIEHNLQEIEKSFQELSDTVEIICVFLREIHKEIMKVKEQNPSNDSDKLKKIYEWIKSSKGTISSLEMEGIIKTIIKDDE